MRHGMGWLALVGAGVGLVAGCGGAGGVDDGMAREGGVDGDATLEVADERSDALAAAPSWTAPKVLSGGGADKPLAAIDAKGRAWVVWRQQDAGRASASLWARRYVPGSGWSAARLLETRDDDVTDPQLAIDPVSGRAMVAWQQLTSTTGYDLWARPFDPQTGWGTAARIESGDGTIDAARLGFDGSGHVIAVWPQQIARFQRFGIWANRFTWGRGWGRAERIETPAVLGLQETNARVAVARTGEAIAVWERSTGSSRDLWSARYTAAGGWEAASQRVADPGSTGSVAAPEIGIDAKGRAMLVWGQVDVVSGQSRYTVQSKRYVGGWQAGSTPVTASSATATGLISTPRLAVNPAGTALVAWALEDGSIRASTAAAGSGWTSARLLKSAGTAVVDAPPAVALDRGGNAFVSWAHHAPGQDPDVWIRALDAATGWSAARRVESRAGPARDPALAMDADHSAVLAWQDWADGVGTRVVARHYGRTH